MNNWTPTSRELPPEGEVVDTISTGGIEQPLKRIGWLWFLSDGSVAVYYEVAYWRRKETP